MSRCSLMKTSFDVAEQHRGRRRNLQPVRRADDLDPVVRLELVRRDLLPNLVVEDDGRIARHGIQAGVLELSKDLAVVQARPTRQEQDLRRRIPVDMKVREFVADRAYHAQVVLEIQVRIEAARKRNLRDRRAAADQTDDRFGALVKRPVLPLGGEEGADLALGATDVGVVDLARTDVADLAVIDLLVAQIRDRQKLGEDRRVRLEENQRLQRRELLLRARGPEDFEGSENHRAPPRTNKLKRDYIEGLCEIKTVPARRPQIPL